MCKLSHSAKLCQEVSFLGINAKLGAQSLALCLALGGDDHPHSFPPKEIQEVYYKWNGCRSKGPSQQCV